MKSLFFLLTVTICASANPISTKTLKESEPNLIALSPVVTTTLLFPAPVSGVFGLGIVTGQSNNGGTVQIDHPPDSNILVLHPLTPDAHVIATVLLEGKLYLLDCLASNGVAPDVAVTLSRNSNVQGVPRAVEVTPQEIKDARPKYDPDLLIGLLRRARDHDFLRPIYPDLYQGYQSRDAGFESDSGSYKTHVTWVHRFSKEDAVVLQGWVENETDRPLSFDGRSATVLVASEIHPVKLLDCLRPIPAHAKTLIDVVIQGAADGGRANLSIDNDFRIILPATGVWKFKNGGNDEPFNVPPPLTVPLTKIGKVKRESN